MNVIVIGCGHVGAEVAYEMYRKGHKVTVIDQNAEAFRNLPEDFRGLTLRGDVLTLEVLLRAGIEHADALAAVTPSDSVNTVLGHIARVVYNVHRVVVRNFDPRKRALHEAFGLQVISPTSMGATRIEEMLSGEPVRTMLPLGEGDAEICRIDVPQAWHARTLRDVIPAEHCGAAVVTRAGRSFLPKPGDSLEAGDLLYLGITKETAEELRKQLKAPREE